MAKVDISAVWDRATEFLGDNLATLMPIALPWIYLPLVVQGVLTPLAKTAGQPLGVGLQLIGLVMTLIGLWGQLQVLGLALDPSRGAGDARAQATVRFLPVVGVSLMLGIAAMLLAVPFGVALAAAGVDFQAVMRASETGASIPPPAGLTPAIGTFMLLYLVVLLIALLWVAARLFLLNAVILAEARWFGAIGESFALTRGRSFALVGVLLLFVVVSSVAAWAAQGVFGSVLAFMLGGEGPVTIASVLTVAVVALVSVAFTLLSIAFIGKYYVAARAQEAIGAA